MKFKILVFLLIFSVIFNNFQLIGQILLSDVIYLFLIVVMIILILKSDRILIVDYHKLILIILTILIINLSFIYNESIYSLLSSCRTLFGMTLMFVVSLYCVNNTDKFYFLNTYLLFVVMCSIYIIIQNIFYYTVGIVLPFDFGSFTYAMNSINEPSTHYIGIVRTGGFFREPSWYAYFSFLALYISFYFKDYKSLGIVSLGLIISTSSAGMGLLFIFIIYLIFRSSFKYVAIFIILFLASIVILYFFVPSIFIRLGFFLETGGSSSIRMIEPFYLIYNENFNTFIGNNIEFLRQNDVFFVNSIVYLILAFGFIGFVFIVLFIINLKSIWISLNIILLLVTEGLLGRPDFWILIAVVNIFIFYKSVNIKNYVE